MFYECSSTPMIKEITHAALSLEVNPTMGYSETLTGGIISTPLFALLNVEVCGQHLYVEITMNHTVNILMLKVCHCRK